MRAIRARRSAIRRLREAECCARSFGESPALQQLIEQLAFVGIGKASSLRDRADRRVQCVAHVGESVLERSSRRGGNLYGRSHRRRLRGAHHRVGRARADDGGAERHGAMDSRALPRQPSELVDYGSQVFGQALTIREVAAPPLLVAFAVAGVTHAAVRRTRPPLDTRSPSVDRVRSIGGPSPAEVALLAFDDDRADVLQLAGCNTTEIVRCWGATKELQFLSRRSA